MSELKQAIRDTKNYINLPLLHEHWYVAGLVEEFGRELIGRTLLEKSIVFYRTEAGELVALQNRCLHRSFPLSESTLSGDNIICGYHGIEYSPHGEIKNVPCQAQCPKGKLRKYPTAELGPLVFIWMGNPDNADESLLPEMPYLENSEILSVHGAMHMDGSYLLMQENLNDLTHFTFLHSETFGAASALLGDSFLELPVEFEERNGVTGCYRVDKRSDVVKVDMGPELSAAVGDSDVWNWNGGITHSPGVWLGENFFYVEDPAPGQPECYRTYINHFVTPETKGTCHYWYAMTNEFTPPNPEVEAMMKGMLGQAFNEDVFAVKHMQKLLTDDTTDYTEINVNGDKAGVLIRRKMLEWVKEEYPELA